MGPCGCLRQAHVNTTYGELKQAAKHYGEPHVVYADDHQLPRSHAAAAMIVCCLPGLTSVAVVTGLAEDCTL